MPDPESVLSTPPAPAPAELVILYRDYRGEIARYRVRPRGLFYAASAWHPEPQYHLRALDLDRDADRDFALAGILAVGGKECDAALDDVAAFADPRRARLRMEIADAAAGQARAEADRLWQENARQAAEIARLRSKVEDLQALQRPETR